MFSEEWKKNIKLNSCHIRWSYFVSFKSHRMRLIWNNRWIMCDHELRRNNKKWKSIPTHRPTHMTNRKLLLYFAVGMRWEKVLNFWTRDNWSWMKWFTRRRWVIATLSFLIVNFVMFHFVFHLLARKKNIILQSESVKNWRHFVFSSANRFLKWNFPTLIQRRFS